MDSLDTFLTLVERYGVSFAFAVYCAVEVRIMRVQMLKVEAAYSKRLEALNDKLMERLDANTDASRGLRDQIHELKNVIQRGIFDMGRERQKGNNGDD